jgi:GNAT superfamily N-acetyltransferase
LFPFLPGYWRTAGRGIMLSQMVSGVDSRLFLVRAAAVADSESLAGLSRQLGYPVDVEEMRKRLKRIGDRADNALFVAVAEGKVIGWIQVIAREVLVADRHAEIGGLVVDESYRGRGGGQALMKQAESWAREHGCRAVVVRTNVVRALAHTFYEKIGYQAIKSQKVFWKVI